MTEVNDRLLRCFSAIFPALSDEEIRDIDLERITDMDSLAGVTLVTLIDEECGVSLELEQLLALRTFDALRSYVADARQLKDLLPGRGN